MQPSTPGIKYPKLRTRQQLTVRYKQVQAERSDWRDMRTRLVAIAAARNEQPTPRVIARIDAYLAECNAWLDALLYALNDQV